MFQYGKKFDLIILASTSLLLLFPLSTRAESVKVNERVINMTQLLCGTAPTNMRFTAGVERGRNVWSLTTRDWDATFDAESGVPIRVYRHCPSKEPIEITEKPLSVDECDIRARSFVAGIGIRLQDSWRLVYEGTSNVDGMTVEELKYRKFVNGIAMPAIMLASVDAYNGEISSFSLFDDQLNRSYAAKLTAQMAFEAAIPQSGFRYGVIKKIYPEIWYEPHYPGKQCLLWTVDLDYFKEDVCGHAILHIDAFSGYLLDWSKSEELYPKVYSDVSPLGYVRTPPANWKTAFTVPIEDHWLPETGGIDQTTLSTTFQYNIRLSK